MKFFCFPAYPSCRHRFKSPLQLFRSGPDLIINPFLSKLKTHNSGKNNSVDNFKKHIYNRTVKSIVYHIHKPGVNDQSQVKSDEDAMPVTANELKTKGISAIESQIGETGEAVITIRGKERFVVMEMEHYHYLRECELEAALNQARADIAAGRYISESVEAHINRVTNDL
jgi:hypothetical protein